MKRSSIAILAGILLAGSAMPGQAQNVLSGVIGGSGDDALVTLGAGDAGTGGLVNVGAGNTGASGGLLDIGIGADSPVATVSVGNGANGRIVDANVGGDGGVLGAAIGGAPTSGNAATLNILTRPSGSPAAPGNGNGAATPNGPANNGGAGSGQTGLVVAGLSGGSGNGSGVAPTGGSSKMSLLARLLEDRKWLRFAAGNAVCLPPSGIANVGALVTQGDVGRANQLLGNYAGDIGNLRNLLKKCGNSTISQADIERAVAVDLRGDGTVLLYVL